MAKQQPQKPAPYRDNSETWLILTIITVCLLYAVAAFPTPRGTDPAEKACKAQYGTELITAEKVETPLTSNTNQTYILKKLTPEGATPDPGQRCNALRTTEKEPWVAFLID